CRALVTRSWTAAFNDFFAYERDDAEIARTNSPQTGITFAVTKSGADWPKDISGLIFLTTEGNPSRAVVATLPISEGVASSTPSIARTGSTAPAATSLPGLIWMLGLAFLGGLILNIMPCA